MKDAFFVRITEADKKKFTGYVGEMRTIITDPVIRVRSLYCTAANVKSYTRYFLDTNYVDAIPDEHGERRFFIVKCSEAKLGDASYFEVLRAAVADDLVIRAFFDFLKARPIKSMYLGKDIPVGEFQKELKDSRRSMAEQFLEYFVLDQPIMTGLESGVGVEAPTEITLPIDDVCKKYQAWQQVGGEFERSKSSIMRELQLNTIPGITKIKPWEDVTVANEAEPCVDPTCSVVKKQVPKYVFDLVELRKRYGICTEHDPPILPPVETIDCAADIRAWREEVEQAENAEIEAAVAAAGAARADSDVEAEAAMNDFEEESEEDDDDYHCSDEEDTAIEAVRDKEDRGITGQKRQRERREYQPDGDRVHDAEHIEHKTTNSSLPRYLTASA